jgi:hypothetical protein
LYDAQQTVKPKYFRLYEAVGAVKRGLAILFFPRRDGGKASPPDELGEI